MAAPGEEDRDDQDGKELPDSARGEYVPAELAAEHVVVPQDGQQRAQGRGRQRQPDRHVVPDVAGRGQPARDAHRDHGGDGPAGHRQLARPLPEQRGIQLVTSQQEQEAEPHVGQQLNGRRLGQAEHVRADEDAAKQEDDHLRNARARQQGDHDRREHRDQPHGHQVSQPLVKVHAALGPARPRACGPSRTVMKSGIPPRATSPLNADLTASHPAAHRPARVMPDPPPAHTMRS